MSGVWVEHAATFAVLSTAAPSFKQLLTNQKILRTSQHGLNAWFSRFMTVIKHIHLGRRHYREAHIKRSCWDTIFWREEIDSEWAHNLGPTWAWQEQNASRSAQHVVGACENLCIKTGLAHRFLLTKMASRLRIAGQICLYQLYQRWHGGDTDFESWRIALWNKLNMEQYSPHVHSEKYFASWFIARLSLQTLVQLSKRN